MEKSVEMSTSDNQPLCFVLMPFGSKPDPTGGPNIDFNRIYASAIKPGGPNHRVIG
jgi:hypothetical protein